MTSLCSRKPISGSASSARKACRQLRTQTSLSMSSSTSGTSSSTTAGSITSEFQNSYFTFCTKTSFSPSPKPSCPFSIPSATSPFTSPGIYPCTIPSSLPYLSSCMALGTWTIPSKELRSTTRRTTTLGSTTSDKQGPYLTSKSSLSGYSKDSCMLSSLSSPPCTSTSTTP
jgi:hypothetical protein